MTETPWLLCQAATGPVGGGLVSGGPAGGAFVGQGRRTGWRWGSAGQELAGWGKGVVGFFIGIIVQYTELLHSSDIVQ